MRNRGLPRVWWGSLFVFIECSLEGRWGGRDGHRRQAANAGQPRSSGVWAEDGRKISFAPHLSFSWKSNERENEGSRGRRGKKRETGHEGERKLNSVIPSLFYRAVRAIVLRSFLQRYAEFYTPLVQVYSVFSLLILSPPRSYVVNHRFPPHSVFRFAVHRRTPRESFFIWIVCSQSEVALFFLAY